MSRKGKGHLFRCYKVKLSFLPSQYYKEEFVVSPQSILNYVEVSFIKKFVAAINKVVKLVKQKRLKAVTMENEGGEETTQKDDGETEQVVTPPDEDEDEDLSDMEEGEGDATASKQLAKKQQQSTYEDPGDSDVEVMVTDNDGDFSDEEETPISVVGGSKENEESDMEESVVDKKAFMDKDRIQQVLESNRYVVDYEYDSVDELWCQFTLKFPLLNSKVMLTSVMDKLAPKSVVWETSMINRGYLSESTEPGETGLWRLKTDGVNLQVLWSYPEVLDLSRAYTNNIHAMANTYGIEAACKSIIKEISGVFRVYGIAVDPRHLSLIADYMTFEGSYKPFNRIGIQGNSSPFQKMSFETTMNFLKNATITGESDSIKSPSACLVTGRVVHGGTGSFELLQSLI